jgi:hypothetical protein
MPIGDQVNRLTWQEMATLGKTSWQESANLARPLLLKWSSGSRTEQQGNESRATGRQQALQLSFQICLGHGNKQANQVG